MMLSAWPASNLGSRVRVPPPATVAFSPQVSPNTWNSGRQPMTTSSGLVPSSVSAVSAAFGCRLAWVSSAPLGWPVVPDV